MRTNTQEYENLNGGFDFGDVYERMVNEAKDGSVFVEVGCYKGKSSIWMAELIKKSGKKIEFICVDCFVSVQEKLPAEGIYKEFASNMEEHEHILIKATSERASKFFADHSVDFVFIDADHSYEKVRQDIDLWFVKVKEGGYIGGHDYNDSFPDVKLAVGQGFGDAIIVNNSWLVK